MLLAALNCLKFSKQKIKILFISSDVYPSTKKNYKETDKLNLIIIMVLPKLKLKNLLEN